jgi:hypothetical protein
MNIAHIQRSSTMSKKRLSIEITHEDQIRMQNLIPWGVIGKIMRLLLIQVLDLVQQHGEIVLGALITGKITAYDLLKKGDKDESIRPKS